MVLNQCQWEAGLNSHEDSVCSAVVQTLPGVLTCQKETNLISFSRPHNGWRVTRPRLPRVSGWRDSGNLRVIPRDTYTPRQGVICDCDCKRSELPCPGTRKSFPKETTCQLPSKGNPTLQVTLSPEVAFDHLQSPPACCCFSPWDVTGEFVQLCGNVLFFSSSCFCLFFRVKETPTEYLSFLKALQDSFSCSPSWHQYQKFLEYTDGPLLLEGVTAFSSRKERSELTGGRPPNVGSL